MNVTAQISSNTRPHSEALHALESMFTQLGIRVAHPAQDEPLLYSNDQNVAWQRYNNELFFYESIAGSSFHIIYNDGKVNEDTSREILYAMLKNRPIFIVGELVFLTKTSSFARDLIMKHVHQFHTVDLAELELAELNRLLNKAKPVDYQLLGSEKILINARVKAHFRELLDRAKN